ncbi:DNA cytosine methyltransferase [Burkholderia pseudomallei]|nr:DNA cytosine methyltransferase [Burkholderia pseudomallei]MBF3587770.1 DNA cytosine methyltransferase [Burkholderia pseudomallei]MBF3598376.1 DNA cytosine methyltransferase [Burkholderia pseudomallei]MBF3810763.1 DNA cytosine methyltransferase [Burkholderia pseudomallei]MBF3987525.1 DNA cytosine methyltransferase [Burkholderia pseudomallei]
MRVLVACEYSGRVREAFKARGHYALSCDLLPTETPGNHYQGDVRDVLSDGWDLLIAHPPCTYLTVAGVRWLYHPDDKHLPTNERRPHPNYPNRRRDQADALEFVRLLMDAPVDRIAIENPVSVISSHIRKPDQVIQPWQFGHGETKATCLWLKNLPVLVPTDIVAGREARVHMMPPGPDRWKERSRTYEGVAAAMATQWG